MHYIDTFLRIIQIISLSTSFQEKKIEIKIYPPNQKFYVYANEILVDVFENILMHIIEYNKNQEKEIHILIYQYFNVVLWGTTAGQVC